MIIPFVHFFIAFSEAKNRKYYLQTLLKQKLGLKKTPKSMSVSKY
jgi:hypothetical protein